MEDFFDFEITDDGPAYRQITEMLREKIRNGQIPVGTRFPPIGKLAKKWNTNYFTVQNALLPLANEGLMESSPRNGTFVRGTQTTCSSVGLYFGTQFWRSFSDGFYSTLFGILTERMDEQGIKSQLWIDHRAAAEQSTPWAPLLKAVDKREVQGVIATMVTGHDVSWLQKLPVPLALAWGWGAGNPASVTNDLGQMIEVSVKRLKELKCRSVGIIAKEAKLLELFRIEAEKTGLSIKPEWIKTPQDSVVSEKAGSALFSELWEQKSRPQGLLVFPDVMARGVMVAMLEKQVSIPRDLKAIFHANAEMAFYCPLPVEWVVTRATRLADALIDSIKAQVAGQKVRPVLLPLELMSSAEVAVFGREIR